MSSVKQDTVKGVFWSAVEKFSNQGIRFLIGLILARLLTPSDFGIIAMLGVFFAISNSFIDSGFGTALIRKPERKEEDFTTVFIFNVVVSILIYAILFFIAPWVGRFFNTPILCSILRVQAVCLIIGGLMAVLDAKLTIELNFKAIAQRSLLSSIISGVVAIYLAYNGFGVWSLVYQAIIFSLVNLIFVWLYCKWKPKLIFSLSSFIELGSFGSRLLAAGLLDTLYTKLTPLAIGKFYTAQDLGYYNRGAEFARLPRDVSLSVFQKISLPVFSKIQNDEEHLIRVYRKYIKLTSMIMMFLSVLLAALSKPVILLLLTDKWADSIIYLQLFCFAAMFNHLNTINLNLLKVKGRSDLYLKLEVYKKVTATLILFAAIPFGVLAICISKIIYTQVAIVFNTYYTGKLYNMGYLKQVKDFMPYFVASLISCVPTYLISLAGWHPLIQLISGGIIASMCYALLISKDVLFKELISTASQQIKRRKK